MVMISDQLFKTLSCGLTRLALAAFTAFYLFLSSAPPSIAGFIAFRFMLVS